jgi:hypothetical protein
MSGLKEKIEYKVLIKTQSFIEYFKGRWMRWDEMHLTMSLSICFILYRIHLSNNWLIEDKNRNLYYT